MMYAALSLTSTHTDTHNKDDFTLHLLSLRLSLFCVYFYDISGFLGLWLHTQAVCIKAHLR